MLDRVCVVGAWAIHELVKVIGLALLGLLAHTIGHGDQHGVGRSAPILLVLFASLCGGALVLILTLGLAFVLAYVEDCSNGLLAGGVVRGFRQPSLWIRDSQVVLERNALMTSMSTTSGSCIIWRTYGCNPIGTHWAPAGSS